MIVAHQLFVILEAKKLCNMHKAIDVNS